MKKEFKPEYAAPELEITLVEESDVVTMSDVNTNSSFDPNNDSGWSSSWI